MKLTLKIEDRPFAGRSLDLQSGVLTIGRDAACGLSFESMTEISQCHAKASGNPCDALRPKRELEPLWHTRKAPWHV